MNDNPAYDLLVDALDCAERLTWCDPPTVLAEAINRAYGGRFRKRKKSYAKSRFVLVERLQQKDGVLNVTFLSKNTI